MREFLLLEGALACLIIPDSQRRASRLPGKMHENVFVWVLKLIAVKGLVRGEQTGVDVSAMEANAALRNIVRRKHGAGYREMLVRLAKESGIETPAANDLVRMDKKREG